MDKSSFVRERVHRGKHLALSVKQQSICHCDLQVELTAHEHKVVCCLTPRASQTENIVAYIFRNYNDDGDLMMIEQSSDHRPHSLQGNRLTIRSRSNLPLYKF